MASFFSIFSSFIDPKSQTAIKNGLSLVGNVYNYVKCLRHLQQIKVAKLITQYLIF